MLEYNWTDELCHVYSDNLYHHGVKGQKWGVRRYQNKDGTLTRAGKKRKEYALKGLDDGLRKHNFKKNITRMALDNAEGYNAGIRKHGGVEEAKKYGYKAKPYTDKELCEQGAKYLNSYMDHMTYTLLKDAYQSDKIKVGQDYISDKYGRVTLTESGRKKETDIAEQARAQTIKDNEDIIKRYGLK